MALRSGRVGIHPSQVDPITGMLLNGPTPGSISFEDLSDAQISNPEAGQTLQYNGTGWNNVFASISPTTLSALQDVQITDVEDGEYLVYDGTNNKWINSASAPTPVTPEGSTVLPTDDIQTWLACAGITDKTYTTLAEVLNDSTTLLALMSNNNAVDYLVRSTTWASGITANSTAMTDIGANNYCANTLLDDATWCDAICNSTYFESVLNVKVPTMTSNTTPSGEVTCSSEYSGRNGWKAFSGGVSSTSNNGWCASTKIANSWVQYAFTSSVIITKVTYQAQLSSGFSLILKLQGSNDGTTFTDIETLPTLSNNDTHTANVSNNLSYTIYRIVDTTGDTYNSYGLKLQFYGRQDI